MPLSGADRDSIAGESGPARRARGLKELIQGDASEVTVCFVFFCGGNPNIVGGTRNIRVRVQRSPNSEGVVNTCVPTGPGTASKSRNPQNSKWREFESAGLLKVRAERNIGVGALARPKKLKRLARAPEKKQRSAQCAEKILWSARIHVGRPCAHVSRVIRVSPWLPVAFLPVTESRVSVCVPAPEVSQTSRV